MAVEKLIVEALIREWYKIPGNEATGGALHITTDDQNVDDHCLLFCLTQLVKALYEGERYSDEAFILGASILGLLADMSEEDRFETCNNWWPRQRAIDAEPKADSSGSA